MPGSKIQTKENCCVTCLGRIVAEQVLIRMQQNEEFQKRKQGFPKLKCVSRSSCMRYLNGSHQITKPLIPIHPLYVTHHHAGPSTLMGILAANYYILQARLAVRNVVRYCVICRRRNFNRRWDISLQLELLLHHFSL